MKSTAQVLFTIAAMAFATQAAAQVTFYENERFEGRSFSTQRRIADLASSGLDARASSVQVVGQRWKACEETRMGGRCVVLRPGRYPSLSATGLNDRISSARPLPADEHVQAGDYAPTPEVDRDFGRRRNERLYNAEVTASRAVLGTPGQRCWIEREQVSQPQPQQPQPAAGPNVTGAVVGGLIGGILGHQVGGGSGQKIATVAGAVGGAALGSQYGRHDAAPVQPVAHTVAQDVRRCDGNPVQATPAYWDVTYQFRGQEHHIQTAAPPGATVRVNHRGEPRT